MRQMIVRDKPRPLELLYIMQGSIIPKIWKQLAFVAAISVAITLLQSGGYHITPVTALPFSLIGIALSIFSGFRNSASYERWWEARKLIGQMVVELRSLASASLAYMEAHDAEDMARHGVAFAHLLRCHLRGLSPEKAIEMKWLGGKPIAGANLPQAILHAKRLIVRNALARGAINPHMALALEERISSLSGVLAGAERIKTTPMPYAYQLLLHRTAYMFCFLLPFGLADNAGFWTPVVTTIVAYTFFGLDTLGDELANPFGLGVNGLPLDAICRTVEINILEMLEEGDLPPPMEAVDYVLH